MNPPQTVPAARRVLFVRLGGFSGSNAQLLAAMRRRRPNVMFDDIDVGTFFSAKALSRLQFVLGAIREYGLASVRSRALLRYRMYRTQSYFFMVRRRLAAHVGDRTFSSSLQSQSLFDAGSGRFPHFVYTDHAALARRDSTWGDGMNLPSPAWLDCEREIYQNAKHVFTFGSSIRQLLIDDYRIPEAKVSCIGGGASVAPDAPLATDLARYARRNVLFVGMDWLRKGGPDLLAAFKILRAQLPDATLTIVGCSPPEARDVEGCVVIGRVPAAEVAQYFRAASCFCMPSRFEPFGIVYLEASRFALPVVATAVGDIGDIVRDDMNGWRVPPGDPAAIAEALLRLLADPAMAQRMGATGAALSENWTWDVVADRILSRASPPDDEAQP